MTKQSIWQGLGAFVVTAENLDEQRVKEFATIGGSWIAPVVYGDDASGPTNQKLFNTLLAWGSKYNLRIGAWLNGTGAPATQESQAMSALIRKLGTTLILLDLEALYQHPGGNASLMPELVWKMRQQFPNGDIGVSTNGMNNSMIWNGRTLQVPQSFYDLRIRCLPQWYSSYYVKDGNTYPQAQMKWLYENGHKDMNFRDPNAKKTNYRGLPLSYVHPTLEVTGLEGSALNKELADTHAAYAWGLTKGFSIYDLEHLPDSDIDLLRKTRETMWLP